MPQKRKEKVDIDVLPYLSVMVIVLKLIGLTLVVMVMPLATNPYATKIVSFTGLYTSEKARYDFEMKTKPIKIPTYIDCYPDRVFIYPGAETVPLSEFNTPGNTVNKLFDDVQENAAGRYIVLLVRPNTLSVYRYLKRELVRRHIDIGYDVLDADTTIDWHKEAKLLNIQDEM